jgi:hypothetical protein
MRLIGISGKIGTGKTATAEELVKLTGFARASFSDALKQEVSRIYGVPLEFCYFKKHLPYPIKYGYFIDGVEYWPPQTTVRELLQWHGTEVRRKQDPAYWTKQMKNCLYEYWDNDYPGVVIDDVRFEDEAEFVKENGGVLVRIDPYVGWEPGLAARHVSETALDKYKGWDIRCRPAFGELKAFAGEICELLK